MKRLGSSVTGLVIVLCLLGNVTDKEAAADPSITDKTTATQLFKEGRALLEEGRIPLACAKLQESQRLDPGGGTLLNLALCHERAGRTATAWVEFTEALGIAKKDDRPQRIEFARTHITQLEPDLSRMAIDVPGAADVPDLEIKRDGSVVARAAWGSAVPVDPGDHVIEATAPDRANWKQSIVVGPKADVKTIVIPVLEPASSFQVAVTPSGSVPASAAPRSDEANHDDAVPSDRRAWPDQRGSPDRPPPASSPLSTIIGGVALGLGVAAAGVGTYLGLHALALRNDANRNCPNDACNVAGSSQTSDAIRYANFSTGTFAAAIAALGVGTVLLITHPGSHSAPSASAGTATAGTVVVSTAATPAGHGGGQLTISAHW